MSANEYDGMLSLTNLQQNLAMEKGIWEQVQKLNEQRRRVLEDLERQDDNQGMYFQLIKMNKKLDLLTSFRNIILGVREDYVRLYISQDVIPVSKTENIEALRYLKNQGWTGKALIHDQQLVDELQNNFIPYILQDLENKIPS